MLVCIECGSRSVSTLGDKQYCLDCDWDTLEKLPDSKQNIEDLAVWFYIGIYLRRTFCEIVFGRTHTVYEPEVRMEHWFKESLDKYLVDILHLSPIPSYEMVRRMGEHPTFNKYFRFTQEELPTHVYYYELAVKFLLKAVDICRYKFPEYDWTLFANRKRWYMRYLEGDVDRCP